MFYSNDIKKLGARIAGLSALLMIVVGCSSPPYGVDIGMTEQQVRDVLGEPTATSYDGGTGEDGLSYMGVGDSTMLEIWFDDNGKASRIQTLVDGEWSER